MRTHYARPEVVAEIAAQFGVFRPFFDPEWPVEVADPEAIEDFAVGLLTEEDPERRIVWFEFLITTLDELLPEPPSEMVIEALRAGKEELPDLLEYWEDYPAGEFIAEL